VAAIDTELTAVRNALMTGYTGTAFRHLERAHILSQRVTRRHVRVHWEMLRVGVRVRDWREVTGQITRMAAAAGTTRSSTVN
jgi:hypothetical protein